MGSLYFVHTSEPTSGTTPETSAGIHKSQRTCFKAGPASIASAPKKTFLSIRIKVIVNGAHTENPSSICIHKRRDSYRCRKRLKTRHLSYWTERT